MSQNGTMSDPLCRCGHLEAVHVVDEWDGWRTICLGDRGRSCDCTGYVPNSSARSSTNPDTEERHE